MQQLAHAVPSLLRLQLPSELGPQPELQLPSELEPQAGVGAGGGPSAGPATVGAGGGVLSVVRMVVQQPTTVTVTATVGSIPCGC